MAAPFVAVAVAEWWYVPVIGASALDDLYCVDGACRWIIYFHCVLLLVCTVMISTSLMRRSDGSDMQYNHTYPRASKLVIHDNRVVWQHGQSRESWAESKHGDW